nr:hypothetical protein [uncultured Draconibacterium sp.]
MKKAVKQLKKDLKALTNRHDVLSDWQGQSNDWLYKRITSIKWLAITLFIVSIAIDIICHKLG